jgi:pimeloyl-ACP methyl ester carboxylesterase
VTPGASDIAQAREVVLASGLWVPAAGVALLRARLRRHGFAPRVFAYYGRESLASNVARLAAFARASCREGCHFVGHSLGGVLVFDMLSAHPEVRPGRVVLLGAPVRGSLSGRRLARWSVGRWLLGGSRERWREREVAWRRPEPLGVIAGTRPLGLGLLLGRLPEPHDGVVTVAETDAGEASLRTLVHEAHSELPFSATAARLAARFLSQGGFA